MTDRLDDDAVEERAVEQALSQAMATGQAPRLVRGGEEADAALVREHTELLGLLPYELAAEPPPAHVWERIAAGIATAAAASGAPRRRLDEVTFRGPVAEGEAADVIGRDPATAPAPRAGEASAAAPPPAARPAWGYRAMAAALAVCLLGLGFTSALVWTQDRDIDELEQRIAALSAEQRDIREAREQLRLVRSRLDMVTTVARRAYPMRRVVQTDSPSQPTGIVYVCGRHQQWYLNLHGLEPPAEGEEYHLWFLTDEGKVDGGSLEVRPDTSSEMEAPTMPDGTQGFVVTLEKRRPRAEPESLTILLGERAINL